MWSCGCICGFVDINLATFSKVCRQALAPLAAALPDCSDSCKLVCRNSTLTHSAIHVNKRHSPLHTLISQDEQIKGSDQSCNNPNSLDQTMQMSSRETEGGWSCADLIASWGDVNLKIDHDHSYVGGGFIPNWPHSLLVLTWRWRGSAL